MLSRRQQGVTLIEMMAGIAMLAVLLAMGVPSFIGWIQDVQIRTAAESVLNGMQAARAEAVRRNAVVRFTLTDQNGQVGWRIDCPNVTADCPGTLQTRVAEEGGRQAMVTVTDDVIPQPAPAGYFQPAIQNVGTLPAEINFDGLGRVYTPPVGTFFTRADITNLTNAAARRYVVLVGVGGQIRMCDPKFNFATDPRGCS
jgi:type IV fimbrial biogenesis protein FimT